MAVQPTAVSRPGRIWGNFLNATECADIACVRSKPTEAIIAAARYLLLNVASEGWLGPSTGYGPVIDGNLVPDWPDRLLMQCKHQKWVKKVLAANMIGDGLYLNTRKPPSHLWSSHHTH